MSVGTVGIAVILTADISEHGSMSGKCLQTWLRFLDVSDIGIELAVPVLAYGILRKNLGYDPSFRVISPIEELIIFSNLQR